LGIEIRYSTTVAAFASYALILLDLTWKLFGDKCKRTRDQNLKTKTQ
jgi:hypothetical protein